MIGYLMRDFVAYWFNHVSEDEEFHAVAERMLADAMGRFWCQLEKINVLQVDCVLFPTGLLCLVSDWSVMSCF
jgi:hypothetical protein